MIDHQSQELIHAAIDGELGEEDLARVRELMAQSNEARQYHDELSRLSEFLDRIPEVDPPESLQRRIVDGLPDAHSTVTPPRPARSGLGGFLRYGFAAAAGLVLAVAIYEGRNEWREPLDVSQMAGTIMKGSAEAPSELVDHLSLDEPGLSVEARLGRMDSVYLLEVASNQAGGFQFEIDLTASGLQVDALLAPPEVLEYSATGGRVEVRGETSGQQQVMLLLRNSGGKVPSGAAKIDLRFTPGDGVEQSGSLSVKG